MNEENAGRLAAIPAPVVRFQASDRVELEDRQHVDYNWQHEATAKLQKSNFWRDCKAINPLLLKKGAQVCAACVCVRV